MKIVTKAVPAQPLQARAQGQVTEVDGQFFLCTRRRGFGPFYMVSLRDNAVGEATGAYLLPNERLCTEAVFHPDGLPVPVPVPVPPVKTKEQHAMEFITWYWANSAVSGASNVTTYNVREVLEALTNANCRRAFAAWLQARGV